MKRAALGFQMHSGWGVLVAVSGAPQAIEILARRRIVTADPEMPGAIQPYHYAMNLQFPEKHIANCAVASTRLAVAAINDLVAELRARHYRVVGSAVLLASGRSLPPLEKILAAHPLIHTAEGEFFRHTVSASLRRVADLRHRDQAARPRRASQVQHSVRQRARFRGVSKALARPSDRPGPRTTKRQRLPRHCSCHPVNVHRPSAHSR